MEVREARLRRPRFLVRPCVSALVVATLLVMSGQPVLAAPSRSGTLQAKLDRLDKKAARLAEEYRGELVQLKDLRRSAKHAAARSRRLQRELKRAREQVAALAAQKYMSGGASQAFRLFMSGEPRALLDRATTADYLAQRDVQRIKTVQELAAKTRTSRRQAVARVADIRHELQRLERNKLKVQRLIDRYQEQAAARAERASPPSSPSSPSSSSVATPGNITPRMSQVYAEIVSRFGNEYGVGCYRPDDSGEHPDGRACDFMLSSGGAVPSSSQVQRGYNIAEWARVNAGRLGIMYIIYRQRIWDARCGCGWESLEDRGSVTANHIDHVHISVF